MKKFITTILILATLFAGGSVHAANSQSSFSPLKLQTINALTTMSPKNDNWRMHLPSALTASSTASFTGLATFFGNILISGTAPTLTLTDEDGNSATVGRVSGNALFSIKNKVMIPGQLGNALRFNDTGETATAAAVTSLTSYSYSLWVKSPNIPDTDINASFTNGKDAPSGGNRIMSFSWDHSNANFRQAVFQLEADNDFIPAKATTALQANTWYHIVGTWDGSNLRIYVNSVNEASPACTSIKTIFQDFIIGDNDFEGTVDELAFWKNRVLTQDDIDDLYASGSGLYIDKDENFPTSGTSQGLNLERLYHMDESSGTNVEDSSDSGVDATTANMEDSDWVTGKINTLGADTMVTEIECGDGTEAGEDGKCSFGAVDGGTTLQGKTLKFNTGGTQRGLWDTTLIIDNGVTTAQSLILRGAVSQSENIFEVQDSSESPGFQVEADFDIVQGSGAAKNYTYTVDGATNDGVWAWIDASDIFQFQDDIFMQNQEAIVFDSIDTFIMANTDDPEDLVIVADQDIALGPDNAAIVDHLGIDTTPEALWDVGGGTATSIDGVDDLLVADDVEIDGDLYVEGNSAFATTTLSATTTMASSVAFSAIRTITSDTTALSSDHTILCNATGGIATTTLPTAVGIVGREYTIKKTDSSLNLCAVDPDGSETIDGSAFKQILFQNSSMTIRSTGSSWMIY